MHRVPLPGTTMIIGLFGFMISAYYTAIGHIGELEIDKTWGFTFTLFFVIIFIASVISITPDFPKEFSEK